VPSVVKAKRDESTDSIIRRFKKRMMIDNILALVKEKEFYKKPALLRKEHNKEIDRRKYRENMEKLRSSRKTGTRKAPKKRP
jgi:small subunit ribosomal protein S21